MAEHVPERREVGRRFYEVVIRYTLDDWAQLLDGKEIEEEGWFDDLPPELRYLLLQWAECQKIWKSTRVRKTG